MQVPNSFKTLLKQPLCHSYEVGTVLPLEKKREQTLYCSVHQAHWETAQLAYFSIWMDSELSPATFCLAPCIPGITSKWYFWLHLIQAKEDIQHVLEQAEALPPPLCSMQLHSLQLHNFVHGEWTSMLESDSSHSSFSDWRILGEKMNCCQKADSKQRATGVICSSRVAWINALLPL